MERSRQQSFSENQGRFLGSLKKRDEEQFSDVTVDDIYRAIDALEPNQDTKIAIAYLTGASLTKIAKVYGCTMNEAGESIVRVVEAVVSISKPVVEVVLPEKQQPRPMQQTASLGATAVSQSIACRSSDPEIFFSTQSAIQDQAKLVCQRCSDREECLKVGLAYDRQVSPETQKQHGVWGGLTAEERAIILKRERRNESLRLRAGRAE